MALLKVTSLKNVSILDPYPMEGIAEVTIIQGPGEYKEYPMLHQQSERLTPLLDRAQAAGLITYSIALEETAGYNAKKVTLVFNSPSVINIGTAVPAGSIINQVDLEVTQIFDGVTESTVGIFVAGTPDIEIVNSRYFSLSELRKYIVFPRYTDPTDMQLLLKYTRDSATQGSANVEVSYVTS